jgi:hypothetical protein
VAQSQVARQTPWVNLSGATGSVPETPQQLVNAFGIPINTQLASGAGLGQSTTLTTPFPTNLQGLVPQVPPVTQYKLPQQVQCLTGQDANVSGFFMGGFLPHGGATICSNGTVSNTSNIRVVPFGGDIAAVSHLMQSAPPAKANPYTTSRFGVR